MKTYSTSKLLVVVFVIVSLFSLPYVYAGKPDKPGKPQEEPTTWSVYIPVDETNGLQGSVATPICVDAACPDGLPVGVANPISYYVYDSSDPATRNFITVSSALTYFNFEVLLNGEDTLPVVFNGVEAPSCDDDLYCEDMFTQISMEQPNGEEFNDDWGHSERIWFGFTIYNGFDYREQPIGGTQTFYNVYYNIDSALVGYYAGDNYIGGYLVGALTITHIDTNIWKISGDLEYISAKMVGTTYVEVCRGKTCYDVIDERWIAAEETASFDQTITLYFVEE